MDMLVTSDKFEMVDFPLLGSLGSEVSQRVEQDYR